MGKNREAVTCNGRLAFYASMYEDIRSCALDSGWAVALHGSLASDMDIMAMPWTENATSFERLIQRIVKLFEGNSLSELYSINYNEKPHGRVVATIPIWGDFYLDISTIKAAEEQPTVDAVPVVRGEWEYQWFDSVCSNCGYINKADSVTRIRDDHNFCPNCGADMRGEKND